MMDDVVSFGQWLRRLRRAHDLTQVELARRIGCALSTIEKLEGDVRRPSKAMAERLAKVLRLPASEHPTFLRVARTEGWVASRVVTPADGPLLRPMNRSRAPHLPVHPTQLIGREHDLATVSAMLQDDQVRLLTLTGPGGIGKTRLALGVAGAVAARFPDGVWFVELASIHNADLVAATIAATLGVRENAGQPLEASLSAFLQEKDLLLLLDNFEQVLAAAPLIAQLLSVASGVTALVTSRAPLRLRGEHVVSVPPLTAPDPAQTSSRTLLAESAAVRLFLARAQAAQAEVVRTDANLRAVAEICRRLDGLPLAIELAAARVKLLPPEALLQRLGSRLKLLTGGPRDLPQRQQTIRNTIDWSYHLLEQAEQTLFARLAVFVGGWTLEAADAVCTVENDLPVDVLDGLQSLIDTSLVRQEVGPGGTAHFTMLETIREYALERLAASGEALTLRHLHARYYLTLAEEAEPLLRGPDQLVWLDRLEAEHDNLRAALAWSQAGQTMGTDDAEMSLQLVGALGWFWFLRSYFEEAQRWLDGALADVDNVLRAADQSKIRNLKSKIAMALLGQALLALPVVGPRSLEWSAKSLALYREVGDQWGIAASLALVGALEHSDHAQGRAQLEESLLLARAVDDPWLIAWVLSWSGWAALLSQPADEARAAVILQQALGQARAVGDPYLIAEALLWLGHAAWLQHDYQRAGELFEESLAIQRELGYKWGLNFSLLGLGKVAHALGDHRRATASFQESLSLSHEASDKLGIAACLDGLAEAAGARSRADPTVRSNLARAVRLYAAAETLWAILGAKLPPDRLEHDRGVAIARAQMDAVAFAAAWAEGQALTLEQAVAYALEETADG